MVWFVADCAMYIARMVCVWEGEEVVFEFVTVVSVFVSFGRCSVFVNDGLW